MVGWANDGRGGLGGRAGGRAGGGAVAAWRRVGERVPAAWGGTDPAVVSAASGGSEDAFTLLYRSLSQRVRRAALRILRDEHAAEDAVQDTFLAVLEGLPRLEDPRAFEAWVLRIARHKALSAVRRTVRCSPSWVVHTDETRVGPHGPGVVARSGAQEPGPLSVVLLRAAYGDLRSCVRETLRLRYGEGLSCQAIARRHGVSVACVKTRLCRGRRDLYDAVRAAAG